MSGSPLTKKMQPPHSWPKPPDLPLPWPCPSCGTNEWRVPRKTEMVTGLICCGCNQADERPVPVAPERSHNTVQPLVLVARKPSPEAHHRICFVLSPEDIARMFGSDYRFVDARFNREQDEVEVVLEGPGEEKAEWRRGQMAYRTRATPLPTAYIMQERAT